MVIFLHQLHDRCSSHHDNILCQANAEADASLPSISPIHCKLSSNRSRSLSFEHRVGPNKQQPETEVWQPREAGRWLACVMCGCCGVYPRPLSLCLSSACRRVHSIFLVAGCADAKPPKSFAPFCLVPNRQEAPTPFQTKNTPGPGILRKIPIARGLNGDGNLKKSQALSPDWKGNIHSIAFWPRSPILFSSATAPFPAFSPRKRIVAAAGLTSFDRKGQGKTRQKGQVNPFLANSHLETRLVACTSYRSGSCLSLSPSSPLEHPGTQRGHRSVPSMDIAIGSWTLMTGSSLVVSSAGPSNRLCFVGAAYIIYGC